MAASGNPRVNMFWNDVPRPFMEKVLRCVFDVYITADDHCRTHFEDAEGSDIRPFIRRAFLEGTLRDVAKEFPQVYAFP